MPDNPTIRFLEEYAFDEISIRLTRGVTGLYFVYVKDVVIPYPVKPSRLIYIGMSESKQNSIGNRIRDHKSGQSGNPGLSNYIQRRTAKFTYVSFDFLTILGIPTIAELEGAFLRSFLRAHGSYPICNNQSGIELRTVDRIAAFDIGWERFAE